MAAYLFMKVLVTDDGAYAEFRRRAPAVIGHYGGRISTRGYIVESQEEDPDGHRGRMFVCEFPTVERAVAYRDLTEATPEQQEVRDLRGRASRIISTDIVEGEPD